MRIGVTGHSNLTADTMRLVAAEIRAALGKTSTTGVTCLARGADQVFARVVLELGGVLEVVLPARDYRMRKVLAGNASEFDELLGQAAAVHTMPFEESSPDAYMAASEYVLDHVDLVLAVWDGEPGAYGGTGDVVDAARRRGLTVTVIWPEGATRDG